MFSEVVSAVEHGKFSPDEPDRYRGLMDIVRHHDYFLVAADFESYYARAARCRSTLASNGAMAALGDPQHRRHGLVLLRPLDPRIRVGDLERAHLVRAVSRRPAIGERERGLRRVTDWRVPEPDLMAILGARHGDPFAILGVHDTDAGIAVRAFVPHAETLEVIGLDGTLIGSLGSRHSHGFFEGLVPNLESDTQYKLRARNAGGVWEIHDPYAFGPVLGSLDDYLLAEGTHQRIYRAAGCASHRA